MTSTSPGHTLGPQGPPRARERDARAASTLIATAIASVLLILAVGGVVLRVRALGFPSTFTFDEELFAKNAQNYLLGLRDANDHPPLGKLLQAVGVLLFGYDSVGWRFASLCFGLHTLLVGFALGRELFPERRAGAYVLAFLASDGFFLAYSRVGLLDGILTCLILWSVLAAVAARCTRDVIICAVLVGLATSVKWSGIMTLVPALVALLLFGRVAKRSLLAFALVPLVHLAIWTFALRLTAQPSDLGSLWRLMVTLFRHHLELGHHQNALASPWYSWIWLQHPIVVKLSQHGVKRYYTSSVGNPVLWLSASVLLVDCFASALISGYRLRLRAALAELRAPEHRPLLVLASGWFALLCPWIVARGSYTFMYHYLPSYAFALLLLAGFVARLEAERPRAVLAFLLLVLGAAAYLTPIWSEFPLSETEANQRLAFHSWRP